MADLPQHNLNTKATVAGGGAGTLLLLLANQIPETWAIVKAVATYAAPFVAVGLAAAWVICAGYLGRLRRRADIDSAIRRAITIRDRVCNDPNASPEHKESVRKTVEGFERLTVELLQTELNAAAELQP